MAVFEYQAYNADGQATRGTISADSDKRARQQLREQGLVPISVRSTEQAAATNKTPTFFRRVSSADIMLMTCELSALVGAGLPIEEALATLAKQVEKPGLQSVILDVRDKVCEGYSLAASLANHPRLFPTLFTSTIAAGEESGHLAEVLNHLALYLERQQELKSKVTQALLYPLLMTLVSFAVIIFLVTFIVPTLVGVFQQHATTLPLMTRMLISASDFCRDYGVIAIAVIGLIVIAIRQLLKNKAYLYQAHQLQLRLPLIKKAVLSTNTTRFAQTLAILLKAGVPLIQSLTISNQLITLLPMQARLTDAITEVQQGVALSKALASTNYFTPMMINFIANGEATGQVDTMLMHAANTQERRLLRIINSLLTIFEPALILLMGGVVLFIVLAVLIPMFSVTQMVV